jgi:hypothetical protein
MAEPKPIYRTDGKWVAVVHKGNLYDTTGEWVGWLDGDEVYLLDGEYIGAISTDGRLLRPRVMPYRKRRRPPTEAPPFEPLKTVPLPPMFAELSYSTVDVFEEVPDIFALIDELRPDAGEKPLPRLVETRPHIAAQERLRKVERELLEEMVYGMLYSYGVTDPPVPVEAMVAGIAPEDAGQVEATSARRRLRIAKRVVQRLGASTWAAERGYCGPDGFSPAQVEYAARALLLPRHFLEKLPPTLRQPSALARGFLVSEALAVLRLHDVE